MNWGKCVLLGACLALAARETWAQATAGPAAAAASPAAQLSAEERQSLSAQRDRLWTDAHLLDANQQPPAAIAKLEEVLPVAIRLVGEKHDEVAQPLFYLADLQLAQGKLDVAKQTRERALRMKIELYGANHWQTKEARLALADCDAWAKLNDAQRQQWAAADTCMRRVTLQIAQNQGKEALQSATQAVEKYSSAAGALHWRTGTALFLQAHLLAALSQPDQALAAYRRAVEIDEKQLGEHATTGAALIQLGEAYLARTDPNALNVLDRAYKLNKKVLGPEHPQTQVSMNDLGVAYFNKQEFPPAIALHTELLAMRERLLGPEHPHTLISVSALAATYGAANDPKGAPYLLRLLKVREKGGLEDLETIRILSNLANAYWRAKDFDSAQPVLERLAELNLKLQPKPNEYSIANLVLLAERYRTKGEYAKALPLYQRAADGAEQVYGPDNPRISSYLGHLGNMLATTGNMTAAVALKKRIVALQQKTAGAESREGFIALHDLGMMYVQQENFAAAAPLLERSLALAEKLLSGPQSQDAATALDALAGMYYTQGNFSASRSYAEKALKIREKFPSDAESLAKSLNMLGSATLELGDKPTAHQLYKRALQISEKVHGANHPLTGLLAHRAASTMQGGFDEALKLEEQAMAVLEKTAGPENLDTCKVAVALGAMYARQGNFTKSLELFERTLRARQKSLGPDHSYTGQSLACVASVQILRGDFAAAYPVAKEWLRNARTVFDNFADIESDRQQIIRQQLTHEALDGFIHTALKTNVDPSEIYAEVLTWKGASATRQRWTRAARQSLKANPAAEKIYAQVESKSRALANAYGAIVPPEQRQAHQEQIERLTQELEATYSQLAEVSQEFRAARQAVRCTPADLQRVLPADTALVDIVQYTALNGVDTATRKWKAEGRFLAFVVRPNEKIAMIELGPAERIEKAVLYWRLSNLPEHLRQSDNPGGAQLLAAWRKEFGDATDPAQKLRQWVWEPLEPHVQDAKITLLAPDGALAFFPWVAMPGKKPGSYLVEDVTLSLAPVPQLLPELLTAPSKEESNELAAVGMLLMGDVHAKGDPGTPKQSAQPRQALRSNEQRQAFGDMPETRDEILAIRKLFENAFPKEGFVQQLTGDQPTEQAFRDFAPKATYVHLAVHGYYDPDSIRTQSGASSTGSPFRNDSEALKVHPDLLCGLAFVGSGSPPKPNRDDGLLTALELQSLNLDRAQLVTLTSCQSANGLQANGEGVLGIQRAFQVAGARSTLAALWSVPVGPTDALMVEFYENLWKEKMTRAEALRQAQIKMLREGGEHIAKWTGKPELKSKPAPPYFWGGFVMAGDWR